MNFNKYKILTSIIVYTLYTLSNNYTYAQNAKVNGCVKDGRSGEPLAGVNIIIDEVKGTISDSTGNYTISVDPGEVVLTYNYIGYKREVRSVNIKSSETMVIDVSMEPEVELLNEIVVSAGKYEQKLSDITVSMEVIKPARVENINATSLEMAINQVPGVDISDQQPSIRGGSGYSYGAGSRVLILVDDMPISSADAGDPKWNFLPVENISQIEIIKGASSALYGSSAMNGVINVRTAFPKDKPETKFNIYNGIYMNPERKELIWWGRTQPMFAGAGLSHMQKAGNLDMVIGANIHSDGGYRENSYEERARFNMNVRYRDKKIKGLSYGVNTNLMYVDLANFFLWLDADSGAYRQSADAASITEGIRVNIDPYVTFYNNEDSKHSLRTRYFQVDNNIKNNEDQSSNSMLYFAEYKYQKKYSNNLVWTIGMASTYSEVKANLFGDHDCLNGAIFLQADKSLFERLKLSLGVRWEANTMDEEKAESTPVFRSGINYKLTEYTFLRASYGEGYRFPTVAEKYTQTNVSGLNIFPNPELNSETGWSAEAGIKQGYRIDRWNGYIDIAGFINEYEDMMEFTFDLYQPDTVPYPTIDHLGFKSINTGTSRITGIDVVVTGKGSIFGIETVLLAGYTYTYPVYLSDTIDTTNSEILKYRYYHSAKADIQFGYKRFTTGFSLNYKSFMINIDRIFEEGVAGIEILPGFRDYRAEHNKGYVVFDYRISYSITKRSEVAVLVRNIFNKEYMGRPGDIGPPRNLTLKYSLKL